MDGCGLCVGKESIECRHCNRSGCLNCIDYWRCYGGCGREHCSNCYDVNNIECSIRKCPACDWDSCLECFTEGHPYRPLDCEECDEYGREVGGVAKYRGARGEGQLRVDVISSCDLLGCADNPDNNMARFKLVEKHVDEHGVGNLVHFGYGTFHKWLQGKRDGTALSFMNKKAFVSFVEMNGGAGIWINREYI